VLNGSLLDEVVHSVEVELYFVDEVHSVEVEVGFVDEVHSSFGAPLFTIIVIGQSSSVPVLR
jgi:hypothetical protein